MKVGSLSRYISHGLVVLSVSNAYLHVPSYYSSLMSNGDVHGLSSLQCVFDLKIQGQTAGKQNFVI